MWRQNRAPGIGDSVENISGEDEVDQVIYSNNCTDDLQSQCNLINVRKVPLAMLSRLESLADKDKNSFCLSYEAKRAPTVAWAARPNNLEDFLPGHVTETCRTHDGEHPLIQSVSSTKHLSESFDDSISDEENGVLSRSSSNPRVVEAQLNASLRSKTEDLHGACTRSTIVEKIDNLATIPKKADKDPFTSEAFEVNEFRIGNKGKEKLKSFSGHGNVEHSNEDDPIEMDLPGNTQKCGEELFIKVTSHGQRSVVTSMAELLENLQQQDEPSLKHSSLLLQNMKGKNLNTLFARKRILPHLGNRNLEDEEDHLECSGAEMFTDDEDNNQNQFSAAIQKITGQTMTDLLQGAFSHSEAEAPTILKSKNSGIGYNGRLQRVLQNEKDRNLEFSKYLQTGIAHLNFLGSLVVQIFSRCLEGKLTVCQCLFAEQTNGVNQVTVNAEKTKMIIFSSKICENVELDVGNFVRIHPPWKEVQINEDGIVMLCLYFCRERLDY